MHFTAIPPGAGFGCEDRSGCSAAAPWRDDAVAPGITRIFDDSIPPRYLCTAHASTLRAREIDQWIEEVGGRTIRVRDLGVALEAQEAAMHAMHWLAYWFEEEELHDAVASDGSMLYSRTMRAAHLARLALGITE